MSARTTVVQSVRHSSTMTMGPGAAMTGNPAGSFREGRAQTARITSISAWLWLTCALLAFACAISVTPARADEGVSVTLTAPTNNALFATPASVVVTAVVMDDDEPLEGEDLRSITKVDFFANGVLIGTDTAPAFNIVWSNPAPGTYALTARVTDRRNHTSTSRPRTVIIDAPPTVALTSPTNGQVLSAPATITVSATAADSDGSVAKVDFYQGATLIATVTSPPYSVSIPNLGTGSYTFSARATDNAGLATTSTTATVSVDVPPTVAITAPASGAILSAPATVTVTATAADADGTVTRVDFFSNGTPVGSATAAPYSATLNSLGSGTYLLTAVATDNAGLTTTSTGVSVTVDTPPTVTLTSPTGAQVLSAPATVVVSATAADADGTVGKVEFFQGANLVGTVTTPPYSVSIPNLASGSYTFSARATDNAGLATTSASVTMSVDVPPTVAITAPANSAIIPAPANITVTATAADADGTVTRVDFFSNGAPVGSATAAPYSATLNSLGSGTYLLTAVATDNAGLTTTSSAVSITVDTPPTVSITAPANSAIISAPANVTVTATAADADGTVTRVDFFSNGAPVGSATAAPYSATLNNVGPGTYVLTAVATDNAALTTTSTAVSITVDAPPTVALTSPANGQAFSSPATIAITGTAGDSDGTVTQIQLLANGSPIATLAGTSPFSFSWTSVPAGTYALSAVATDNNGLTTTSNTVSVTANKPPIVSLIAPPNNGSFTAPATITLTATATDSDGSVATVQLLNGAGVVTTIASPPYTFTLTNVTAGSYTFYAKATDNLGATTTSIPVNVTVTGNTGAATVYYIYTDQLNTPRAITNEAAVTVWTWANDDPFGNNAPNENPSGLGNFTCNLRFPGQYFDQETGTHYNYFRDYDPSTGRYIQSDPIGLTGGVNTYAYVGGNPISWTDPYGLSASDQHSAGLGDWLFKKFTDSPGAIQGELCSNIVTCESLRKFGGHDNPDIHQQCSMFVGNNRWYFTCTDTCRQKVEKKCANNMACSGSN